MPQQEQPQQSQQERTDLHRSTQRGPDLLRDIRRIDWSNVDPDLAARMMKSLQETHQTAAYVAVMVLPIKVSFL